MINWTKITDKAPNHKLEYVLYHKPKVGFESGLVIGPVKWDGVNRQFYQDNGFKVPKDELVYYTPWSEIKPRQINN